LTAKRLEKKESGEKEQVLRGEKKGKEDETPSNTA